MLPCCSLETQTPEQELAELNAQLAEVRAAITAALDGQSYTLNTGQTQIQVTVASMRWLQARETILQQEIAALKLRACGRGAFHGTPNW